MIPGKVFLTKGVGRASEPLESFEMALRDAQIANFNLVQVTSIFPPGARIVGKKEGLKRFTPGEIVFCVMSKCQTNEPHRLIAASIGIAIPKDKNLHGYLSEHHAFGQNERKAGDYAEDLAARMLASTLGLDFDPDEAWDSRRQLWRLEGKIVRTMNHTQTAVGEKKGQWTSVLSAAILCP